MSTRAIGYVAFIHNQRKTHRTNRNQNNQTPQQSQQKFTQAGAGGNGHIPLMHETYAGTVDTLTPWLINWAKNNNLKLVTVGKLHAIRLQALVC